MALAALREPALHRPVAADWRRRLLRPPAPRLHEGRAAALGQAVRSVGDGRLRGKPADGTDLLHLAAAAVRDEPRDVVEGVVPTRGGYQRDAVRDLLQRPAHGARAERRDAV